MQRSVVVTAIRDKRVSSAVARALESACYVQELSTSDFKSMTTILRRADPVVAVLDLEIADRHLDLEHIASPMSFGLVLLASRDDDDAVEWLDRGADAFLKPPVSVDEIVAQAMSIVRKRQVAASDEPLTYDFGSLHVDLLDRAVTQNGHATPLSATEFKILRLLVRNAGRTVPHDTLLLNVWGEGYDGDLPLLRSFIRRLRSKLGDSGTAQIYIQTRGQLGYSMPAPTRSEAQVRRVQTARMDAARRAADSLRVLTATTRAQALRIRAEVEEQRRKRRDSEASIPNL